MGKRIKWCEFGYESLWILSEDVYRSCVMVERAKALAIPNSQRTPILDPDVPCMETLNWGRFRLNLGVFRGRFALLRRSRTALSCVEWHFLRPFGSREYSGQSYSIDIRCMEREAPVSAVGWPSWQEVIGRPLSLCLCYGSNYASCHLCCSTPQPPLIVSICMHAALRAATRGGGISFTAGFQWGGN